jgi:hypothetical protein
MKKQRGRLVQLNRVEEKERLIKLFKCKVGESKWNLSRDK